MNPPRTLQKTGRNLFKKLLLDYQFTDAASFELLERACMAADRAQEARDAIKKNGGPVSPDRFGVPRRHPGVDIERDATATMISCFKLLGLHSQRDPKSAGRNFGS